MHKYKVQINGAKRHNYYFKTIKEAIDFIKSMKYYGVKEEQFKMFKVEWSEIGLVWKKKEEKSESTSQSTQKFTN